VKKLVYVILILFLLILGISSITYGQGVPYVIYGHVYMPDGSPAVGAKVTVTYSGGSGTTTTDSKGYYQITITLSKTETITVKASKSDYSASKTFTANPSDGGKEVNLTLKKSRQPSPPPPKPSRKSTQLLLKVSNTVYRLDQDVELYGYIYPATSVEIALYIVAPDGSSNNVKIKTLKDGSFHYVFSAYKPGLWKAYAVFSGNNEFRSSRSNTVTFSVKTNAFIDLSVDTGKTHMLIIRGDTRPPLINTTVNIYVSLNNGFNWIFLTNVTTDKNGEFVVSLNLTVGGKLLLKAVTQENEYFFKTETDPIAVNVSSPETETLREELKVLKDKLDKATLNLTTLISERSRLLQEIKMLKEKLNLSQEKISELENENLVVREEAKRFRDEANFYSILAVNGIPLALLGGVVIGIVLGKKFFFKSK